MSVTREQVAADLRAAADVLERDGWTQGKYHDRKGCGHCVLGAIAVAIKPTAKRPNPDAWSFDGPHHVRLTNAQTVLQQTLREIEPLRGAYADGWNDAPERTADEVIAALRAAADRAEATP